MDAALGMATARGYDSAMLSEMLPASSSGQEPSDRVAVATRHSLFSSLLGLGHGAAIPLSSDASALDLTLDVARKDKTHEVLPEVAYRRLGIANVVFYGPAQAGDRGRVLVDAGLPGTKGLIKDAAAARFGVDARPVAIIMTHGHFDHVGALEDLTHEWDAPVYAHQLELPYLNGCASYSPGDPSVGGGLIGAMARLYPRGPVDVEARLQALPGDGTLPGMPAWVGSTPAVTAWVTCLCGERGTGP